MLNAVWSEGSLDADDRSHYALCTLVNLTLDQAEGLGFVHRNGWDKMPADADGAVVLVHGGHQLATARDVISRVEKLGWAVTIVFGDEEGLFPTAPLKGPRHKVWVQMPVPGVHDHADRRLICGYPHDCPAYLLQCEKEKRPGERPLNWAYIGQVNNENRRRCVAQLKMTNHGFLHEAPRFWSGGIERDEYYRKLASCKVAPCPTGAATPDTLRVAEALEAGCVPIVEDRWPPGRPRGSSMKTGYWNYVLQETPPFPMLTDWQEWPRLLDNVLHDWPHNRNLISVWWHGYKQRMCRWLEEDVRAVRGC